MRKAYSVWYWPYAKRYYLTHPWYWFRDLGRNIRDVYRRAKYGWTYTDVWDMDQWIMNVFPPMLRHMADHGSAYPGCEPFDTPEKWHDWLHEMADLLDTGREDWQDEHNEYYEEYMDKLMDKWEPWKPDENGMYHAPAPKRTELDDKYFARAKELSEQGEANVRRAFENLGQFFYNIWD